MLMTTDVKIWLWDWEFKQYKFYFSITMQSLAYTSAKRRWKLSGL